MGLTTYSSPLFEGKAAYTSLANTSALNSTATRVESFLLSDNVWAILQVGGSSGSRVVAWDGVADVGNMVGGSGGVSVVSIQGTGCSTPCASGGVCAANSTCACSPGFSGATCSASWLFTNLKTIAELTSALADACAEGFFGKTCDACPTGCANCDDGITGSGRCLDSTAANTTLASGSSLSLVSRRPRADPLKFFDSVRMFEWSLCLCLCECHLRLQRRMDDGRQWNSVRRLFGGLLCYHGGRLPRCVNLLESTRAPALTSFAHHSLRPLLRDLQRTFGHLPHLSGRPATSLDRRHQVHDRNGRHQQRHFHHLPLPYLLRLEIVRLRRLQPALRDLLDDGDERLLVVQESECSIERGVRGVQRQNGRLRLRGSGAEWVDFGGGTERGVGL